jgi:hypothetical protein
VELSFATVKEIAKTWVSLKRGSQELDFEVGGCLVNMQVELFKQLHVCVEGFKKVIKI